MSLKTYVATPSDPRARLAAGRRDAARRSAGSRPRSRTCCAARQAGVHAAHRHRRLRRGRQRREGRASPATSVEAEALPPPLRLSRAGCARERSSEMLRAPAGRGHPAGGEGHAAAQPARPPAAAQAEGLCGAGPSARGAEAASDRGRRDGDRARDETDEQRAAREPAEDERAAEADAPQEQRRAAGARGAAARGRPPQAAPPRRPRSPQPEPPAAAAEPAEVRRRGARPPRRAARPAEATARPSCRERPEPAARGGHGGALATRRGRARRTSRARSIELAADARYSATGKRKSSVARVIIRPGNGQFELNGRSLEVYFPRRDAPGASSTSRSRPSGYLGRVDVGRGSTAAASRARPTRSATGSRRR